MSKAKIKARGLKAIRDRLDEVRRDLPGSIEAELGELALGFFEDLTGYGTSRSGNKVRRQLAWPGNGLWPVGKRFLPIRKNQYVRHDGAGNAFLPAKPRVNNKGTKQSGRSINAWRMELEGATLRLYNDARVKGKFYSQYIHKVGDPEGQAVRDARGAFRKRGAETLKRLGKSTRESMTDE